MRLSYIATYLAVAVPAVHAASLPNNALERLEDHAVSPRSEDILSSENPLEKRKGGGGRGGGGSSSSGGGGGRGSSGGAAGRTSPSSNAGGSTRSGTGPSRAFGGGGFYGGGSSTPYKSGSNTPKGLAPGLLISSVAVLAIMPGLWLYNVYPYHFNNPYRFYNQSAQNQTNPNGTNQTLPVTCLCQEYSVCGCDENDDEQYLKDLVGNGSYAALNKTLVTVSDVNGTQTLVLNGSLPNGTTAPGGSDDDDSAAISLTVGKYGGYWVTGLIVLYTCALM